jgi:beta-glucosidase
VPILYGIDAVHGHNNVEGAVIFPHAIGLGATRDPALVEQIGRVTAREVAATGIDWTFAPVLAVARDERWGRTYESFGEDPDLVGTLGAAMIRGLQGERPGAGDPSVLACAKHFLGDGGTTGGVDRGDTALSEEELRRVHLAPYRAAIAAHVGTVMASFSSIDGVPMHCHGPLLTDVLKGELGFNGFVVSDWQGAERIGKDEAANLAASIGAGVDMFMAIRSPARFVATVSGLVADGRVEEARIDDAVDRILTVKCEQGLLTTSEPEVTRKRGATVALQQALGGAEHRAVARQAVRESVVVLKNQGGVLPLARGVAAVHVAGVIADDLGSQCGGWTIDWQGRRGRPTPGTTLLEGIREVAGPAVNVTYSVDGSGGEGAGAFVAVVGEAEPYAEAEGDRTTIDLSADDAALVERLGGRGAPVIVVLVTGRPLVLGETLARADAVLVAWLPGTEGGGVADVLYGVAPATGKLGHSWPRSSSELPINVGEPAAHPEFPFGFGIELPVAPRVEPAGEPPPLDRPLAPAKASPG